MDKREIQRAVRRGAKLLDKKIPDWYTKIDLNILDMRCGVQYPYYCGCIGAQLAPASSGKKIWTNTMEKLFDNFYDGSKTIHYGFLPPSNLSLPNQYFKLLDEYWTLEVMDRLNAK